MGGLGFRVFCAGPWYQSELHGVMNSVVGILGVRLRITPGLCTMRVQGLRILPMRWRSRYFIIVLL